MEKISQGDMNFYQDTTVQKVMNDLERETLNAAFGISGKNEVELLKNFEKALNSLDEFDMKHEFHRFFFLQYMRSPTIHKNQTDAFNAMKSLRKESKVVQTKKQY